jgi:formamidopyrimidine-DNA glycosylase
MPELPEVETIRRGLVERIRNQVIAGVKIRLKKMMLHPEARRWSTALRGQRILDLRRRGKYLIFDTDQYVMLVHLGMTGQLTYWDQRRRDDAKFQIHPLTGLQRARQHAPDKHTHVRIELEDGNAIYYRDIRQFGKWRLYRRNEFEHSGFFDRLGLEPFGPDYRLKNFLSRFEGRKLRIKSLLLDQRFVAGVGNIYADEALFQAGLHPERPASGLSEAEKEELFRAIPKVLRRGLQNGGTTVQDFINAEGESGGNQAYLRVYGRVGEKCRHCRSAIVRIVVNQRSSHFCPHCQPASK